MKLSAVWITKNEEANIARTIASVADVADELVVVDTGSTDKTVAIAQEYGARVVPFEWVDDFSAARNFALEQVDGDILIFLDADEWFEPKLGRMHRQWLENMFFPSEADTLSLLRENIDTETGFVIATDITKRILRGNTFQYVGIIHEQYVRKDGRRALSANNPLFKTKHSGYGKEISQEKMRRNAALLEKEVAQNPDGPDRALYEYYLMREYDGMQYPGRAYDHFRWLLEHPAATKQNMRHYPGLTHTFLLDGVRLAADQRARASRRQVRSVLVENVKALMPHYPGSKTADLLYELYFDYSERRLLAQIDDCVAQAEALRQGEGEYDIDAYLITNTILYNSAAQAAWHRGQREKAFEYAGKAVLQEDNLLRGNAIEIILRCTKGLPYADIIQYLNSIFDISKRGNLDMLISYLHYEGYTDLYVYYMKKLLDAGWAKKSDYWYLLVVLGKWEEAIAAALAERDTTEADVVRRTLFLAIAAGGTEQQVRKYQPELGPYAAVLEAMFGGRLLEAPRMDILFANYQVLAFAAGRGAANRLLHAFGQNPEDCFAVQYSYYFRSGLYEEFLAVNTYTPAVKDATANQRLANVHLMAGRHQEALALLQAQAAAGVVTETFFNLCAVLAEVAQQEIAAAAQALYDSCHEAYESWIDDRDVANTCAVMDFDSKKQRRELERMTKPQWDAFAAVQAERLLPVGAPDILRAAEVFQEQKSYYQALRCLATVSGWAEKRPEVQALAAEIFAALGNNELAGQLGGS